VAIIEALELDVSRNVTVIILDSDEWKEACSQTLAAFEERGIRVSVVPATVKILKELSSEGYSALPVVKLARENDSWQGYRPDRITAYQPRASELDWTVRRVGKPSRAWLR